jgi:hypothetical protein
MAEIDDYIEVLFYMDLPNAGIPQRFVRRDELVPIIRSALDRVLADYPERARSSTHILAETFFDRLLAAGAFSIRADRFAGTYYHYAPTGADAIRTKFLKSSEIYSQYMAIGDRFFPDVFAGYLSIAEVEDSPVVEDVPVPASDRIVTLAHNQVTEIERPLDEVISALEEDNGIPEHPGLKERLLGQIRAGRELVRVGTFRAYLVYVTLLSGLAALVDRYKGHAIGALAETLIGLLIKHIFGLDA